MDRKTLASVILLMTLCLSWAHELGSSHDGSPVLIRQRRNIWQFSRMIKCATGRSAFDYNNYGCHCGIGGGGTAVDDVDRCCEAHDTCYDDLIASGNGPWSVYISSYDYSRTDCKSSQYEIKCEDSDTAKQALCECDKAAADCFAGVKYDAYYQRYDKDENC